MSNFIRGLSSVIVACLLSGCSCSGTKPAAAASATDTKARVMQAGGTNVLQLTVPADVKSAAADGSLRFAAPQYEVQVWLMPGVQSVDDGAARVAAQIVSEFKDFIPDRTTTLTIAGSPAKRLVGTGHEADDGDAGAADLIVFKVGDRVFVACYHGESLTPAGQQGLLTLAQTAKMP